MLSKPETKKDGTDNKSGKDVVSEVDGKKRKRGGRKRLEAERSRKERDVIEQDQNQVIASAEVSLERRDSSCASRIEIESISTCYLIWPFKDSSPSLIVARGRVYPTSQRTLHGRTIADGFVKVQVDDVNQEYRSYQVPPETETDELNKLRDAQGQCIQCPENDELNKLGDAQGQFIQWPRNYIKILNDDSSEHSNIAQRQSVSLSASQSLCSVNAESSRHSSSPVYRPQFEKTYPCQDPQLMPLEDERFTSQQPDMTFFNLLNESYPLQSNHVDQNPDKLDSSSDANDVIEPIIKNEKIASLLTKLKKRENSGNIYRLAEKLACLANETPIIQVKSPMGMYNEVITENVEIQALLRVCLNKEVDVNIFAWFATYLYTFGEDHGIGHTAYFNPRYIELRMCNITKDTVIKHIQSVMKLHKDKQEFIAPYLAGSHWSLILITRYRNKHYFGSIIDSISKRKDAKNYMITELIEEAIGETIPWEMVKCYQENGMGLSGHYVLKAMFEFVVEWHERLMMNNSAALTQDKIDTVVASVLRGIMDVVEI
ncbi:hypothetical protein SSX86_029643 [Deinandra increscens subsp. villosa]|uniref:DUF8039 domain-containing protein n=1 Tax=Deinandra increscens subsp. villosa TaxID=3103831 RepID=A0AAP0CCX1_9ASTR